MVDIYTCRKHILRSEARFSFQDITSDKKFEDYVRGCLAVDISKAILERYKDDITKELDVLGEKFSLDLAVLLPIELRTILIDAHMKGFETGYQKCMDNRPFIFSKDPSK